MLKNTKWHRRRKIRGGTAIMLCIGATKNLTPARTWTENLDDLVKKKIWKLNCQIGTTVVTLIAHFSNVTTIIPDTQVPVSVQNPLSRSLLANTPYLQLILVEVNCLQKTGSYLFLETFHDNYFELILIVGHRQ